MKNCLIYLFALLAINSNHFTPQKDKTAYHLSTQTQPDSTQVIGLNKKGFEYRLNNPKKSLAFAEQALHLAKRIHYRNGIAEAYRVKGIAKYYLNESNEALSYYLAALKIYTEDHNILGQARVFNNMGNLYSWADYDKALNYFNKSLELSRKLNDDGLSANLYLNMGNIYVREKKYDLALKFYDQSTQFYEKTEDQIGLIHCLKNKGKAYLELMQLERAEKLLHEAREKALPLKINGSIASIDLNLVAIHIFKKEPAEAEKVLKEGIWYAKLAQDNKLVYDFEYCYYELEYQRKNYKDALRYLRSVYKRDSLNYTNSESARMTLMEEQFKERERQRENELLVLKEKQSNVVLLSITAVAFMALVMVAVLAVNIRRKMKTNAELTQLNGQVTKQKERLNAINQNLEKLIDERTKDLQIKNQKLSEYSAHLSHEIRGPVASMLGLLILEEEKIIEHDELVDKMKTCINNIDDKIRRINEMLNNPDIPHLKEDEED